MEREEPTIGKVDPADLEFRPRSYRGPSRPQLQQQSAADRLAWKLGVAVGVGVLMALLIFNAYERYQTRRDLEETARYLEAQIKKSEKELAAATAEAVQSFSTPVRSHPRQTVHPLPPGYRCSGATLLTRQNGGWMNITERHNHWYCPEGGKQSDCYRVTPRSVGCVR